METDPGRTMMSARPNVFSAVAVMTAVPTPALVTIPPTVIEATSVSVLSDLMEGTKVTPLRSRTVADGQVSPQRS